MPKGGFEPPRVAPHAPQTCVSTSSTTSAFTFEYRSLVNQVSSKRIGLLGGTFNPVHNGHLQVASHVYKYLSLDGLLFLPSGIPPHKTEPILPSVHRLAMIRLAISDYSTWSICDMEIKRPGPSYTLDTLHDIRKIYPSDYLFFILGSDTFRNINGWKGGQTVLTLCDFVIMGRQGYPLADCAGFLAPYLQPVLSLLDRKEGLSYHLPTGAGTTLHFLKCHADNISATDIRLKPQIGPDNLPPSVASYMMAEGLV